MSFILHLLTILAGVAWLGWMFSDPRTALIWSFTLGFGFLGSNEGFLGTCLGLIAGATTFGALRLLVTFFKSLIHGLKEVKLSLQQFANGPAAPALHALDRSTAFLIYPAGWVVRHTWSWLLPFVGIGLWFGFLLVAVMGGTLPLVVLFATSHPIGGTLLVVPTLWFLATMFRGYFAFRDACNGTEPARQAAGAIANDG